MYYTLRTEILNLYTARFKCNQIVNNILQFVIYCYIVSFTHIRCAKKLFRLVVKILRIHQKKTTACGEINFN